MAIDLNSASVEELAEIPGVDPDFAQTIIEYRDENGGFMSIEDLRDIPGCTEEMIIRLQQAGVTVEAPTGAEGNPM